MKRTLFTFLAAVVTVAIICCSEPKPAKASTNNPTLGGCVVCLERNPDNTCKTCQLSAHPTIIQPLAAIDLKTSTLLYGLQAVSPGVCYGVTYQPGAWYASGASFCLNTAHTEGGNVVFPSGIVQLLKWGEVGIGGMCSDANSSDNKLTCHALLLFGANVPIE
jgi:hypothetical protein